MSASFGVALFLWQLIAVTSYIYSVKIVGALTTSQFWKLPRLYVGPRRGMPNNLPLRSGSCIPLSPDQTHYLINVMRILKKRKRKQSVHIEGNDDTRDCVRIFNNSDGEWLAKVEEQEHESPGGSNNSRNRRGGGRLPKVNTGVSLVAQCIRQLRTQDEDCNEDDRPWILFAPLKKQPRMKLMIEKCTELGVGILNPVTSDRMEGGALMCIQQFDKLELQCIEASEQCERLGVPVLTKELALTQCDSSKDTSLWNVRDIVNHWCYDWEDEGEYTTDGKQHSGKRALLICRERGDTKEDRVRVVPVLQALHGNQRVAFLVGPEGGWSAEEEKVFDEICSKYSGRGDAPIQCISLGSSVLRAETACMMAVGAWALVHDS